MSTITAAEPVVSGPGEGDAYWWFGALTHVKATAEQTAGRLTLAELAYPPNWQGPLHVHHGEDEGFYVLEGTCTFRIGDRTVEAAAGTYLHGPLDVPHGFSVGPEGARLLFLFLPGGFEGFIRETGVPAPAQTIPPAEVTPDPDRVEAALPRYRAELLD